MGTRSPGTAGAERSFETLSATSLRSGQRATDTSSSHGQVRSTVVERADIDRLFTFTDYGWKRYEETIRPLGDDRLTEPAPGSGWPALRDALGHINWAYIRWLASPDATTDQPKKLVNSWDELDEYRRRVRGDARLYFDSLDDDELSTPRKMDIDGKPILYSPGEILAHVMLHERQHHGDLNTLLYQHGVDIPIVEYRFSLPDRDA